MAKTIDDVGERRGPLVPLSAALLAVLGSAASTGLLIPEAAAEVARRRDDDSDASEPLLIMPSDDRMVYLADHRSHSSHRSHESHRSHSSGGYGGGGGGYGGDYSSPAPEPAPPPPPPPSKPAKVAFVAYPGGRVFVDGQLVGRDATGVLTLKAGAHTIRVENQFLGSETRTVNLDEAQTGTIEIEW